MNGQTYPLNLDNRRESRRANGVDYIYEFLSDGWIAIYKFVDGLPWTPLIQAKTVEKADEYICFREETIPLLKLC